MRFRPRGLFAAGGSMAARRALPDDLVMVDTLNRRDDNTVNPPQDPDSPQTRTRPSIGLDPLLVNRQFTTPGPLVTLTPQPHSPTASTPTTPTPPETTVTVEAPGTTVTVEIPPSETTPAVLPTNAVPNTSPPAVPPTTVLDGPAAQQPTAPSTFPATSTTAVLGADVTAIPGLAGLVNQNQNQLLNGTAPATGPGEQGGGGGGGSGAVIVAVGLVGGLAAALLLITCLILRCSRKEKEKEKEKAMEKTVV